MSNEMQEKDEPVAKTIERVWDSGFNQGLDNAIEVLKLYKGLDEFSDKLIEKVIPTLEGFKKEIK